MLVRPKEECSLVRQGRREFDRLGFRVAEVHHGRLRRRQIRPPHTETSRSDAAPILNHTNRGEIVYDPFLGSGTTLAAAELAERICFGIELDPKYVDVIVQRWQTLAGKQAVLEGDGRSFDEIAQDRRTAAA